MKYLFKDPKTGRNSRKSTYAFASFSAALIISGVALFKVIETSLVVELVTLFMLTFLTLMGFTVWNKMVDKEPETKTARRPKRYTADGKY